MYPFVRSLATPLSQPITSHRCPLLSRNSNQCQRSLRTISRGQWRYVPVIASSARNDALFKVMVVSGRIFVVIVTSFSFVIACRFDFLRRLVICRYQTQLLQTRIVLLISNSSAVSLQSIKSSEPSKSPTVTRSPFRGDNKGGRGWFPRRAD